MPYGFQSGIQRSRSSSCLRIRSFDVSGTCYIRWSTVGTESAESKICRFRHFQISFIKSGLLSRHTSVSSITNFNARQRTSQINRSLIKESIHFVESFQIGYPIVQSKDIHPLEMRNKLTIELFQIRFRLRLHPSYFTQRHHTGKYQIFDTFHGRNPFCPKISLHAPETFFLFG